jgi:hypothetical protein
MPELKTLLRVFTDASDETKLLIKERQQKLPRKQKKMIFSAKNFRSDFFRLSNRFLRREEKSRARNNWVRNCKVVRVRESPAEKSGKNPEKIQKIRENPEKSGKIRKSPEKYRPMNESL